MRFNIPSYAESSDEETESEGEGRRGRKGGRRGGKKKADTGACKYCIAEKPALLGRAGREVIAVAGRQHTMVRCVGADPAAGL